MLEECVLRYFLAQIGCGAGVFEVVVTVLVALSTGPPAPVNDSTDITCLVGVSVVLTPLFSLLLSF
ncbi:hypothetical protein EX30DRAFT_338637 [Ascodesmis nigricans]|uniref:Uncharacterized protein n=1 Tax=Ascodesmis nigricans TaxID=341454 RepID=A0A4S2N489_9PEZI|nr:hypothetical protein EX30DRAFT_338637 [Ascodesmis nigricans]